MRDFAVIMSNVSGVLFYTAFRRKKLKLRLINGVCIHVGQSTSDHYSFIHLMNQSFIKSNVN